MINPLITDENPAAMTPTPAREVKPTGQVKAVCLAPENRPVAQQL